MPVLGSGHEGCACGLSTMLTQKPNARVQLNPSCCASSLELGSKSFIPGKEAAPGHPGCRGGWACPMGAAKRDRSHAGGLAGALLELAYLKGCHTLQPFNRD